MKEVKPSGIEIQEIKIIEPDKISESNELKWKSVSKKYSHIYDEAKTKASFSNIIDNDAHTLLKLIIDFYYESKTLDRSTKNILDSVKIMLETIEWNTKSFDKREFLARIDALLDYIYVREEINDEC